MFSTYTTMHLIFNQIITWMPITENDLHSQYVLFTEKIPLTFKFNATYCDILVFSLDQFTLLCIIFPRNFSVQTDFQKESNDTWN